MLQTIRTICIAMLFTGVLATVVQAQTAPSLVPPAFLSAKTVFISNAGSDSGLFPHPFTGDESRGYSTFYADLQAWGHYQLVDSPAKADVVFELQLIAPPGPSSGNKQNGASDPLPMFRLTIYDRKTHYVLWALTESVNAAELQKTHDHNFDQALANLVDDLKAVVTPAK